MGSSCTRPHPPPPPKPTPPPPKPTPAPIPNSRIFLLGSSQKILIIALNPFKILATQKTPQNTDPIPLKPSFTAFAVSALKYKCLAGDSNGFVLKLNLRKEYINRKEVRIFDREIIGLAYTRGDRGVAVADRGGRLKLVCGKGLWVVKDFGR
jgi:hypothetical protein